LGTYDDLASAVNDTTADILRRRRRTAIVRRRGWLVRRLLLAGDLLGLVAAILLAEWLATPGAEGAVGAQTEILLFLVSLPGWILVANLYGLYERDEAHADHSTVDELIGVFHMVTVCTAAFGVGAWLAGIAHPHPFKLVIFWLSAIVLVPLARGAARAIARRRMSYLQNAVIVGAGDVGQRVAKKLLLHPEYGINVVGFVDQHPKERHDGLEGVTILGGPERLGTIIRLLDVERVIVAFSNESREELAELVASLKDFDVQVDIVPRFFEVVGPRATIHALEGLPLVGLRPLRMSRVSIVLKRALDVGIALAVLIAFLPVFAAIAVLIRLGSAGPVIHRDVRIGRNGARFRAFKFRTMYVERGDITDEALDGTLEKILRDPVAKEEFDRTRKLSRDPRVTPLGKWLRRWSLDELPQFINVIRGDVSLVGPRPITQFEFERYASDSTAAYRPTQMGYWNFNLRPGLTGYWQINGRSSTEYTDRLRLDLLYLTNWSLALDFVILAKTARVIARGNGAF
jgi:exopolysaccharide biosynthesis polyprenyl glycosylphosphotransferase